MGRPHCNCQAGMWKCLIAFGDIHIPEDPEVHEQHYDLMERLIDERKTDYVTRASIEEEINDAVDKGTAAFGYICKCCGEFGEKDWSVRRAGWG